MSYVGQGEVGLGSRYLASQAKESISRHWEVLTLKSQHNSLVESRVGGTRLRAVRPPTDQLSDTDSPLITDLDFPHSETAESSAGQEACRSESGADQIPSYSPTARQLKFKSATKDEGTGVLFSQCGDHTDRVVIS
ncbi:hypothetical protein Bbelb_353550 [Branchiostoma belcheri]|nr:hypothetical protein Bbelb_353550 [Branchiostoma belcheri]